MSTYAVGDIQGCLPDLLALLEKVKFGKKDTLWVAGDLVNRGPQSLETLRFCKSLGRRCKVVLGNHDLHLLACWHGAREPGRKDTFNEILNAPDSYELLDWLQAQPLMRHSKKLGYSMVHAGIPPIWDHKTALARAKEVHMALQTDDAPAFFHAMYGNEPDCWSNKLCGNTRLRVITNYLTRMRFCDGKGRLEFVSKGQPEQPPEGFQPWFSFQNHRCKKERIIFGHWAALMGKTHSKHFIGLDTGCVWGGYLSLLRLDDGARFTSDCC